MRQYIGARYVPTFADPLTWDNSHSYEALMMVDYMGDTYTSKKPVPPGVAITDTEYWVMTGSFNSQLNEVRTDLTNLTDHVNDIDEMFYDIDYLKTKKYILIGDSYAEFAHSWLNKLKTALDLVEGTNVFSSAIGGVGFVNGSTPFPTTIANISAPADVDYIIVVGGYNDRGAAGIQSAISTFVNTAKTRFPKAKVLIGMAAWQVQSYDAYIPAVYGDYRKGAISAGAIYMDNIEYTLHNYSFMNTDGFHPVEAGSQSIFDFLLEFLQKGHADVYIAGATTLSNDTGVSGTINVKYVLRNGITKIGIDIFNIAAPSKTLHFNNASTGIGTLQSPFIGVGTASAIVPCYCKDANNVFYTVDLQVYLNGNTLYVTTMQTNDARNNFRSDIEMAEIGSCGRIDLTVDSLLQY